MYTSNAKKLLFNKLNFENFKNKTFVITGYTSGIGKNLFDHLNALGSKLILVGRKKIKHHLFFNCDLSKSEELEKIIKIISKKNNVIDGVVHCAAINEIFKINKVTLKNWNEVLSVNLTSAFIISKYLKKNLSKAKNPSIVFVSSIAGHRKSLVSGVHYVSSKAGLIGLSKQLSHEFGKYNIRVNCISPSQTMTKMLIKSMTKKQIKGLVASIPLNRLATVYDQTYSILFLLSPLSNYITGMNLKVDGGQL